MQSVKHEKAPQNYRRKQPRMLYYKNKLQLQINIKMPKYLTKVYLMKYNKL